MKTVYEVLEQKEFDIRRVRKEIEALHFIIPLLTDDQDWLEQGIVTPPPLFSVRSRQDENVVKKLA